MASQTDIETIGQLPMELTETSGLIYYNNRLITHNDSGNDPVLYEFDAETLEIVRTVTVLGVVNTDWEDITQDEDFIYIGDIGNNNGDRGDLNILRIAKADYDTADSVNAERINFMYEDQTDFTTTPNSDFDAEALFSLGNDLIVLTKQWQQMGTVAYRIPKFPGTFLAERAGFNQIDGLVTGASFDSGTGTLHVVGYSNILIPFFASFDGVDNTAILDGALTKNDLTIGFAQVEALTQTPTGEFFATSEAFSNPPVIDSPSRLFRFTLDDAEEPEEPDNPDNPVEEPVEFDGLIVFKPFGSQALSYSLNVEEQAIAMGIFDVGGRLISYTPLENLTSGPIDISSLNQSLYYLGFFFIDDSLITAPFFRD